ncbi:MAG: ParM/StbA family protein [Anaerolineae bacterium]|nr:ParM/StbA family protein [Anaerolineae bacterium]
MPKTYTLRYTPTFAIDAGNGTTCVINDRNPAALVFPSVIQQVEDVRLDGSGSQGFVIHVEPMRNDSAGIVRKSWAIGDTAILLPGLQTRITSANRIGSEYQLVLILAATVRALADMVESEAETIRTDVHFLLNLPPVYFGMADRLYALSGDYTIEYEGKFYELSATVQHVYPEGAGAAACYFLNDGGRMVNPQFASGRTGIVDGGWRTVDAVIFEGMTLLENTATSLTNSISGVYQLAQRWAMEDYGEHWGENEIEKHIRAGFAVLRETKQRIDLSDMVADLGARLADLIISDVFEKQWHGLGDVDRVILAGGVAYMVEQPLKDRFPNAVMLRSEFSHTADLPYELMNATGHIRLLKAERLNA